MPFTPPDDHYEQRIRESFASQKFMTRIGASVVSVAPGEVVLELPYRDDLTQQNGFLHAGIVTSIVDVACGYAAYTLMPADSDVLSVEFKVNLMAPGAGERFHAIGRVLRNGRTLSTCAGEVWSLASGGRKQIAAMLATMIRVDRGGQP
jgi:uncharacterized protein (TIGR00369 family)